MSLRAKIQEYYHEAVALSQYPDEMKRALKASERVPTFINKLEEEVQRCPMQIKPETLKLMVYDMTALFLRLIHRQAHEKGMSELAKIALQQKADQVEKAKEIAQAIEDGGEVGEEVLDL